MKLNFYFPIQIFFVFSSKNIIFFLNKTNLKNFFFFFINYNFINILSFFLKNELFFSNNFLIDSSLFENNFFFNKKRNKIIFYNFYFFYFNMRIFFFSFINIKKNIKSIDLIYKNANWIEREISEMYGIFFLDKNDSRKLLLNYSSNFFPLKKTFFLTKKNEYFLKFNKYNVITIKNPTIEL